MPALILCLIASTIAATVGHSLVREDRAAGHWPRLHSLFIRNMGVAYAVTSLVLVIVQ